MKKDLNKIYAEVLYNLLEKNENTDSVILNFLNLLKKKSQLHRTEKIIFEFKKLYNKKNGIANLKIKSARPLDTKIVQELAKALGLKKYDLQTEADEKILGGFMAEYDDNLIDFTLKNSLERLHNQLKS